jgi:hypothetical protein
LGKQDLKFGEGNFLKLKEDQCSYLGKKILSLGKESFSSSKKINVIYLGKKDLEFGEGKFLKLKKDPCNILGEARS